MVYMTPLRLSESTPQVSPLPTVHPRVGYDFLDDFRPVHSQRVVCFRRYPARYCQNVR